MKIVLVHYITARQIKAAKDFPGGPVVKNPLPMQGTWVQSLVGEYSTCSRTPKPECGNY